MHSILSAAVSVCLIFSTVGLASPSTPNEEIVRDVAIIGGGSAGTYAAIALRQLGHSVVVVEKKDRMGGHTETYTDPATGETIDIGVQVWHNTSLVTDYFAHLDVPLVNSNLQSANGVTLYTDFATGKIVSGYTPTDPSAALEKYADILGGKYPYIEAGFDLPYPVPEDLVMPFGEFVKKYDLADMVYIVYEFGQGLGDILQQPTIYIFKNFGLGVLDGIKNGFLTTANHDNSELYLKATAELGEDVLLSSTVLRMDRDAGYDGYVRAEVETPQGVRCIKAKKVVLAIPQKLEALGAFDLDEKEASIFKQFRNTYYYTTIVKDSGILDNTTLDNVSPSGPYNLGSLPGSYTISPSRVPGLHNAWVGSQTPLTEAQVKSEIVNEIRKLKTAGTLNTTPEKTEFVVYSDHSPFTLTVPPHAIQAGFYKQLYGLQGYRNMFYTGAALETQDSTVIWEYTAGLVKNISAVLG